MSVQITSTTDSEETVRAAAGNLQSKEEEKPSAPAEDAKAPEVDESKEENSEALEEESDDAELAAKEDDDSREDEDQDSDDEESAKPKRKSGFEKRIKRYQKRVSEKEKEIEYWRAQALKSTEAKEEAAASDPEKSESLSVSDKPKEDDFDTHAEFIEALGEWSFSQAQAKFEAKQKEEKVKSTAEKQVQDFQAKVNEFAKEHDDFEEVISEVDDIRLSAGLQESIMTSELGPEVMYELAQNRKELERINGLSVLAAAREVGKIESRIAGRKESSSSVEAKKQTTKAPPPPNPVKAKSSGRSAKNPDEMNYQEYKRWREAQLSR